MKLVSALGAVGVISCCKAVCHDSGVESVDAARRRRGLNVQQRGHDFGIKSVEAG